MWDIHAICPLQVHWTPHHSTLGLRYASLVTCPSRVPQEHSLPGVDDAVWEDFESGLEFVS